jgi:hypothetical protein
MKSTDEWRKQLEFLTVSSAAVFLRNLGEFHNCWFQVLCSGGYKWLNAISLCLNFNPDAPVAKVGPVYFCGGPSRVARHKGDYLTYLVDCAMAAQMGRSTEHVESTINRVRGTSAIALPKPELFYDKVCKLISALHKTRKPIEHGLEEIGLCYTDYDLDDVEEKMLEAGLGQCESCGLWLQVEKLWGDCA